MRYILLCFMIVGIVSILIVFRHLSKTEINLAQQTSDVKNDIGPVKPTEKNNPQNYASHVILGESYIKENKLSEAERELGIALKAEPDNNWVLKVMGNFYFKKEEYSKAEEYYIKALKSDKKNIDKAWIYHDLAQLYLATNKTEKALDNEKKALTYLPENLIIKNEYYRIRSLCKK